MLAVLASINSIFPTIFLCVVHRLDKIWFMVRVMVFKASYNNISGISWRTALLMEETEYPEYQQKTIDLPQVTDKLYHIILYRVRAD
jgi:hypothetical protein